MSNSYDSGYPTKSIFTTQNLVLIGIGWAVLALLYFLLFSAKLPSPTGNGQELRDEWYLIGTYVFESVAYLGASVLCLRNWLSPQIVSSRNVWLSIGLGMLSYFIGGIIFDYTEIVLKQDPDISFGDIFFVINYLCLGTGMILALTSRRINLEKWQWAIIIAIGVCGSLLAWWISQKRTIPDSFPTTALNWFYIVSDVFLLITATTLLLTFWGGKVSLSWRMIAAAAFSLYIADMWFKYAQGENYQSGDILEVFWVFSGVLFGMGAVLEYDSSNRKRRTSGRKRT